MRADRLLSILIMLQSRGKLTAQVLAKELEVSERTIYRDMDALSAAGVPVYCERGPGGGCALLESYRTNLTGLNRAEVRALFMLSIPAPLQQLGVDQDLRAALLKLSAAVPEFLQPEGSRARARVHLDSSAWFQSDQPTPHLGTIRARLVDGSPSAFDLPPGFRCPGGPPGRTVWLGRQDKPMVPGILTPGFDFRCTGC